MCLCYMLPFGCVHFVIEWLPAFFCAVLFQVLKYVHIYLTGSPSEVDKMASVQHVCAFVVLLGNQQSLEPAAVNAKHAFLSLQDKLICQQQEVMLLPFSQKGNS